jgi:uncharacterized protein involved in tolerance to divalent cations
MNIYNWTGKPIEDTPKLTEDSSTDDILHVVKLLLQNHDVMIVHDYDCPELLSIRVDDVGRHFSTR